MTTAAKEAQLIFGEELPVVPLFLRLKLAATRPDMCNFIMDPTNNSEMWNIEAFDYGDRLRSVILAVFVCSQRLIVTQAMVAAERLPPSFLILWMHESK